MAKIKITKSKQLKNKKLQKHATGFNLNDPVNGNFYTPGSESLPYNTGSNTRRGYQGNTIDQQNDWVKQQLNQKNINNWNDPNSDLNKDTPWRQEQINELQAIQPDLYNSMMSGNVPQNKLEELYTESEIGPLQSLVSQPIKSMQSDPGYAVDSTVDSGLMPIPGTQTNKNNPDDPDNNNSKNPEWLKYADVASNLAGLIPDKAILANPSTYSVGNTRAYLGDVNRGDIKGQVNNMMRNVGNSGGSGGSNRANTLAAGLQGMNALNTAQQQIDVSNRQQLAQNDARNVGSQNAMAAGNTGILNQFELENKQLQNDVQASNRDNIRKTITSIGAGLSDIGGQNSRKNILNNTFDYNTEGNYQNGINSNNNLQSVSGGNRSINSIPIDKGNYATEDLVVNDSPDLIMGNVFSNRDNRQQNREYRKSLGNVNDVTLEDEAQNELLSDYDPNAPIDATIPQRPNMKYFSKRDVRKGRTTPSLLRNGGYIKKTRYLK